MKISVVIAVLGTLLGLSTAFGQSSWDSSPDSQTGEKVLGSYFATDIDTVSMTDGNLHLQIPVFSLPGRETPLSWSMDYNSKLFQQRTITGAGGGTSTVWDFLGWRKNSGVGSTLTSTFSSNYCGTGGSYNVNVYWIEWNGTKHQYSTTRGSNYCPQPYDPNNLTFDSTESDLVRVQTEITSPIPLSPQKARQHGARPRSRLKAATDCLCRSGDWGRTRMKTAMTSQDSVGRSITRLCRRTSGSCGPQTATALSPRMPRR